MSTENDIADLISQQLDRLLDTHVTAKTRKTVEEGQFDDALWRKCEALGLTGALVPESAGGAGLSWTDITPSLLVLGKHAAPVPLGETLIANRLLSDVGMDMVEGAVATGFDLVTLTADDSVQGTAKGVSWAPVCPHTLLLAEREGQLHLCLMRTDDLTLSAVQTFSREPAADVTCSGVKPLAIAALGGDFSQSTLVAHLAVLHTAQIAGALAYMLPLCVEYAGTRVQFGRPIAKFQAIQHALAQLASEAAATQAAAVFACGKADARAVEYGAMVGMSRAGRAATLGAEIAHQVFGAIGFTDEHSLHYYTRRLWQWRSAARSEQWWSEKLGEQIIAAGGDALWPHIVAA
jgi:acyl-CoA dehydrogenase